MPQLGDAREAAAESQKAQNTRRLVGAISQGFQSCNSRLPSQCNTTKYRKYSQRRTHTRSHAALTALLNFVPAHAATQKGSTIKRFCSTAGDTVLVA
mmetsp:Transcript_53802/g.125778  ORF Transcript_53802/g.125778 Transcript_53802/m.125778 type:complete len:97 (-) Transcript_53802:44-334(-)